jgi:hypothetical protein
VKQKNPADIFARADGSIDNSITKLELKMDYQRMLFAYHVRTEALAHYETVTKDMTPEQADEFKKTNMSKVIASIVKQTSDVAKTIDAAVANIETGESNELWGKLGSQ